MFLQEEFCREPELPLLDFYLIIINNDCESLKVSVFKALHATISAKEETQSKRLIEAIEMNKSFISHLVQSLHSCESLYSLKWNLIALLSVNIISKDVQNFLFFETQFFLFLQNYLEGQLKELELHSYLVENIKSLCICEQFQDKVSQTFSWLLLKNLFTNLPRFLSEGFSSIVLSYSQIFLLLKNTSQMKIFFSEERIFAQLTFSFLHPKTSLETHAYFLRLVMICVQKEIPLSDFLDHKYTLFKSGFLCKANDRQDALTRMLDHNKIEKSGFSQVKKLPLEQVEISRKKDSMIEKSFKLGSLLTDCFENAVNVGDSVVIGRCLVLFHSFIESKCIVSYLKQKSAFLDGLPEDHLQKVEILKQKLNL